MSTTEPPALSELQQRRLDQLYWDTDMKITAIGEQFGIPKHRVSKMVTPRPLDSACWRCGTTLAIHSRSERSAWRYTCRQCSATTGLDDIPPTGDPRDAAIVVGFDEWRFREKEDQAVAECRSALEKIHQPWSGKVVTINLDGGGRFLVKTLESEVPDTKTVAITSIRSLASSDTDAVCTFAALVAARYRVISAEDFHAYGMDYRAYAGNRYGPYDCYE